MSQRFLSLAGIGMITAAVGVLAFASSAFAAAQVESLKLTGPNTIVVVYSEPVYTSPNDYIGFTNSYSGESVTSVDGSGSNTITLNLSNPQSSASTGYVTIGTNVQDVNDSEYVSGSTWNIISAIGPAVTSFGMSSSESDGSFAGTGNTITVTFGTNEQVNVLSMTINGHPVSVSGGGTGPFSASYTMNSGDAQQSVPVTLTLADNNNDQTSASFSYTNNGAAGTVPSGSAVVSSIVSNANTPGVLTDGDSITFTLTPTVPEPNARITGSYNGELLTWATTNNGVNYVATYIVETGQPSPSVPVQISGVTLTDQYGNVSAPASGYDIQKTVDAAVTATPTASAGTTSGTTGTASNGATSADVSAQIQALDSQLATLQAQVGGGSTTSSQDGSAGFDFTEFLGVGSQDAQVTALQERLTSDGLYVGPITGFYGTLTQAAVEKFQATHGITQAGYVGPGTRAALNAGD